nr:hypothetical protein Iba_chr04bCG2060 [Ipomoea batatas]
MLLKVLLQSELTGVTIARRLKIHLRTLLCHPTPQGRQQKICLKMLQRSWRSSILMTRPV